MKYFRKHIKYILLLFLVVLAYNLYFLFLLQDIDKAYLYYLDFLTVFFLTMFTIREWTVFRRKEKERKELLDGEEIIWTYLDDLEDEEILKHDMDIVNGQLSEQFDINCELQDYIAKWCHEVKIPLSAALLIDERIEDPMTRQQMREQLEKIRQHLNSALTGCKVQSSIYDLQIQAVGLKECVSTSIKNNQFFLINRRFEIFLDVGEEKVYTDKEWLVYVLDQMIGNAMKYAGEKKELHIWSKKEENRTILFVEDKGEGIKESDIRRIYEKGFTGQNHHNGQYKSTGMGLYMVSLILKRLGHDIDVESEYGKFTRFSITFKDNRDYFNL
ncbi:sensor histidine kinase [Lachnoclostridium sp. An181]|uniref:sensor histidine kinase n=1 Tax=Lachnoclostridium sp. An181 TaxID=1965575 RepID=UPI0013A668AE|nr:sensor histidine kinase [Lachnoclostridium sp. An181]